MNDTINSIKNASQKLFKNPITIIALLTTLAGPVKLGLDHYQGKRPNITVVGNDDLKKALEDYVHFDGPEDKKTPSEIGIFRGEDQDPYGSSSIKYFQTPEKDKIKCKIKGQDNNRLKENEEVMFKSIASYIKKYKETYNIDSKFSEEQAKDCLTSYILEQSEKKSDLWLYLIAGGSIAIIVNGLRMVVSYRVKKSKEERARASANNTNNNNTNTNNNNTNNNNTNNNNTNNNNTNKPKVPSKSVLELEDINEIISILSYIEKIMDDIIRDSIDRNLRENINEIYRYIHKNKLKDIKKRFIKNNLLMALHSDKYHKFNNQQIGEISNRITQKINKKFDEKSKK